MLGNYQGIIMLATLIENYRNIRHQTELICQPLATEDYVIQSMPDVSPPKWHLAHTTWFFETFILKNFLKNYQLFDKHFHHLFNSYYQSFGNPFPRNNRGLLSRPRVRRILKYRQYIDKRIIDLLASLNNDNLELIKKRVILGLHHEMQHQELLLMDIKHIFSINPIFPIYYKNQKRLNTQTTVPLSFINIPNGTVEIGHQDNSFCYDNELPNHKLFVKSFSVANRLITNNEYLEFINAGGYQKHSYWLADGWDIIQKEKWQHPLYWHKQNNEWYEMTLSGLIKLNPNQPVCHISYYEADAYACWAKKRLLTEFEWEFIAKFQTPNLKSSNLMENNHYQPIPYNRNSTNQILQLFGDVWEWTSSAYHPYPRYKRDSGALGEYNAKFMSNQIVLRGGSCITPQQHIRTTYRNFFQPDKRWQCCGIRLAGDLES